MRAPSTYRKPRYFFAVFGAPRTEKPKVEAGSYPPKGYITSLDIMPGDVMLLYCTEQYIEHFREAPGIGIVINATEEIVYYQYYPLDQPVGKDTVNESLKDYENRLKVLSSKGNWLFEIGGTSFRSALKGRRVNWP